MNCSCPTECHVLLHGVWDAVDFFITTSKRLHNQMAIVASEIVKYNWNLDVVWVYAQLQITGVMGCSAILACDVAVVANLIFA